MIIKYTQKIATGLVLMVLMAVSVSAETKLPDPGITPDSPFYFLDRMFSVFKSSEALADERMAEIIDMAQKGHERGLAKAQEGYARAMDKRQQESEEDENTAEEVARQTSNHLAVLAQVREQVSEQAKSGIDLAITESANERENALATLEKKDRGRSIDVAEATLQKLISNTTNVTKTGQEGLQRALDAVRADKSGVNHS